MASLIEIRLETGSLDLPQGFHNIFYITRQVFDLSDFQTRNADFTKSFNVPVTPNNVAILASASTIAGASIIDNKVPCQIIVNGITIAPVASLLQTETVIENGVSFFNLTIFYGNFNLFDTLGGTTIDRLNWADLAIGWETTDILAASKNTYLDDDVVWPLADWNTRDGQTFGFYSVALTGLIDINTTGFFLYARNIIERMIGEIGYTLVIDDTVPGDFNKIALACPVTKYINIEEVDGLSFSSEVGSNADQTEIGTTAKALFQSVISDIEGIWDAGNNQYLITDVGDITLNVFGAYTMTNGHINNPVSRIVLYLNSTEIAFINTPLNQTVEPFFISAEVSAVPGDTLHVEIEAATGIQDDELTILAGNSFKSYTPGIDASRTVQPSEHIPQIDQSTFLANMLKLFNLFIITDDINKTVTLKSFNALYTSAEIDLSGKLSGGATTVTIQHYLSSIAQNTALKWQEDNLLRRDANTIIEFDNQIIAKETTLIEMDFSACDSSVLYFDSANDTNFKAKLPMVSIETTVVDFHITVAADNSFTMNTANVSFLVGDFFIGNSLFARVTAKTSDTTGVIEYTTPGTTMFFHSINRQTEEDFTPRLAILQTDGAEVNYNLTQGTNLLAHTVLPFLSSSLTASWLDSLKMENIASNYYGKLFSALQSPEVIKANFNLTTVDVTTFDFTRPIYISQFNAFYYCNKINQYKVDQLTQLELVRISTITEE